MGYDRYSDQLDKAQAANNCIRPANLREQLTFQLREAQTNVARLEELLALLDKNPEVNRIMELLGR